MPAREAWSAERIGQMLHGQKSGRYWKCKCPAHDDRSPSLVIWKDPDGHTAFHCYHGCDWHDVRDQLRAMGAVIGRRLKPDEIPEWRRIEPDEVEKRRIDFAKLIWAEGVSVYEHGARVLKYLDRRGLALPRELDGPLVRYHFACPHERDRMPAMLVAMRQPDSPFVTGVSRTFLDWDGFRIGGKMMLGRSGIAKFAALGPELHVAEGFESGLALHLAGQQPAWSTMAAGNMARLPVLDGIEHLIAHLDNDESGTGRAAGVALHNRWTAAGRTVDLLMTDLGPGHDPADEYRRAV